jgi:hypothetical protein
MDHLARNTFCTQKLKTTHTENHNYNIVIGPISLPPPKITLNILQISLKSTPTTQIGFCIKRSQDWLNSKVTVIYQEDQLEDSNKPSLPTKF